MKTLSIVIPCRDEAVSVPALFERLADLAARLEGIAVEVVCVNDGSRDGTLDALLAARDAFAAGTVVVVDLSRNFGKEAALSAGLTVATGDAVVPMDADLQDPPEVVVDMVRLWNQGAEVVVARRAHRSSDSWFKRASARAFYRLQDAISEVPVPAEVGDFRLMDREVVDVVNRLPENHRFMKGLFAWAGFATAIVEYDRSPRSAGESNFSNLQLWRLALEGITSFSLAPLRIASYLGSLVAAMSFLYGGWIVLRTWIFGKDLPGYASIFTAVLFLGGVQLICLGIIGEYLGRTYVEAKRRPAFVIRRIHRREG